MKPDYFTRTICEQKTTEDQTKLLAECVTICHNIIAPDIEECTNILIENIEKINPKIAQNLKKETKKPYYKELIDSCLEKQFNNDIEDYTDAVKFWILNKVEEERIEGTLIFNIEYLHEKYPKKTKFAICEAMLKVLYKKENKWARTINFSPDFLTVKNLQQSIEFNLQKGVLKWN